tara:strand:- start:117566 stop:118753 length:1188 start_codon:yes stop_codon:yes gene_type:complete
MPEKPLRTIEAQSPREQVGAVTGSKYEYQYQRAAATCLELLESDESCCVFCEWHDDYVFERPGQTCSLYAFHQVKTTQLSKPWSTSGIFGIGRRSKIENQQKAQQDCMAARLFEHVVLFGDSFDCATIVTNGAAKDEVTNLLEAIACSESLDMLDGEPARDCALICRAFSLRFEVDETMVYEFLRKLRLDTEVGSARQLDVNLSEIGHRIYELSEIELNQPEVLAIGRQIVDLVRRKSHAIVDAPVAYEKLKIEKGISAADVLELLSLSPEGYATLRTTGNKAALHLSRLHRLCQKSGVPEELIPDICQMKSQWDAWYLDNRHRLDVVGKATLDLACDALLKGHAARDLSFAQLASETSDLATRLSASFADGISISKVVVLGRVFAMASERTSII